MKTWLRGVSQEILWNGDGGLQLSSSSPNSRSCECISWADEWQILVEVFVFNIQDTQELATVQNLAGEDMQIKIFIISSHSLLKWWNTCSSWNVWPLTRFVSGPRA